LHAAFLVKNAWKLLLSSVIVIEGYAHDPALQRVRAETIVDGTAAQ